MQDGSNWYVYCGNNPLNAVDPTGLEFEWGKFLGRVVAIGTSALEAGLTGNPMAIADTVSAIVSTVAYAVTDGDVELSTSTIGLTTQLVTYAVTGGDADAAAIAGAAGDIVAGGMSVTRSLMNLSNMNTTVDAIQTFTSIINISGDFYLGGYTLDDVVEPTIYEESKNKRTENMNENNENYNYTDESTT